MKLEEKKHKHIWQALGNLWNLWIGFFFGFMIGNMFLQGYWLEKIPSWIMFPIIILHVSVSEFFRSKI